MTSFEDFLLEYPDDEFIKLDGYDDAVIGVALKDGLHRVLVYSLRAILNQLEEKEDLSCTEAEEWYGYNIERAITHMGQKAPIIFFDD